MKDNNHAQIKKVLKYLAHKIVAKYHPYVIGITGSVGKTSARHAIASALSYRFKLREPQKNYNNEFGIMLTLFGTGGLEKSHKAIGWVRVIAKALAVWLLPQNYPKMLVLEYGIDHPGDMDDLIDIIRPDLAVLTTIGISHLENFPSQAALADEKGKLPASVSQNGIVVYNNDNELTVDQVNRKIVARKFSFGRDSSTSPNVLLKSVEEELTVTPKTTLVIQTPTRELAVSVPVLGMAHQQAILTAIAVAESLEVETDLILKGLAEYRSVPGRLNVIAGIKKSILIDDSYNAAPQSTIEALKLLSRFPNTHKIAALGDMLELGDDAEKLHREVGQLVAELGINELVAVGQLGKYIAEAAKSAGLNESNVHVFEKSDDAKELARNLIDFDSVILVKGSQGARMEKISKELLAEPMAAPQLLPRQYGKWIS